ncbi:MAG: GNAT family N-acetyltransferase [Demequina sp.]|uniref:GNAT family N-acetyltransferase n=1 Tax=Demequina sp. TaxID=2050685 RepID=UPI003A8365BD
MGSGAALSERVDPASVRLRRWTDADVPVLESANSPEMMALLAGPEDAWQLHRRHERYLRGWDAGTPRMFTVRGRRGEAMGSVGWWESRFDGRDVYELGWVTLPEFQGRGVASQAARLAVADAVAHGDGRDLMACPPVENKASNGVCAAAGFQLVASQETEFRGVAMMLNYWVRSG